MAQMGSGGCTDCLFYSHTSEGEYGGGPYWSECSHPQAYPLQNLKSFPFRKKQMPCFSLNFWLSDFACLVNPDLGAARENRILQLWKRTDRFGKLSSEEDLKEFEKLKSEFCFKAEDFS